MDSASFLSDDKTKFTLFDGTNWFEQETTSNIKIARDEGVLISIYTLQAITLTVCVCFRYFWYKDVGLYSLQVGRPQIYIFKHLLHLMIILLLFPNFFNFLKNSSYHYNMIRIMSAVLQIVLWAFSSLILRFEYRRALGHIWYMHPIFIWFSAFVYATDLAYC